MTPIFSTLAKPLRWLSSGTFPPRLANGASRPPWSWRAALLAVLVSFGGFLGLPYLLHHLWKLRNADLLFPGLVVSIPMLCCLKYLARGAGTTAESVFGLRGVRVSRVLVSAAFLFLIGSLVMLVAGATLTRLGFPRGPEPDHVAQAVASTPFLFLDATLWAPVYEEFCFRALLYTSLRTRLPVAPSTVITAAAFALVHTPSSFQVVAVIFCDALLQSVWYERTRCLWPNIISHGLYNLLAGF